MRTVLMLVGFLMTSAVWGQKIHRKCGPAEYFSTRSYLQNDSLNLTPFNAIVHINMKGWGTATFINDSTLITARHVADKNHLKGIDVYKNVFKDGTVTTLHVRLDRGDFSVRHAANDNCHFISRDMSLILLTPAGKEKVRPLYTGHLEMANYADLNLAADKEIVLTGYPVDLAEEGLNGSDILSNKRTTFGELLFDKNCMMVGYKLFTCSGDSGAPIWVEVNGKYYIIAIHHGGPENGTIFGVENRNSAALIRNNMF